MSTIPVPTPEDMGRDLAADYALCGETSDRDKARLKFAGPNARQVAEWAYAARTGWPAALRRAIAAEQVEINVLEVLNGFYQTPEKLSGTPLEAWCRYQRMLAAEGERDRLRAALEPLREQLQRFLNAGTKYRRCALYLDGPEAEALARAALGEG